MFAGNGVIRLGDAPDGLEVGLAIAAVIFVNGHRNSLGNKSPRGVGLRGDLFQGWKIMLRRTVPEVAPNGGRLLLGTGRLDVRFLP